MYMRSCPTCIYEGTIPKLARTGINDITRFLITRTHFRKQQHQKYREKFNFCVVWRWSHSAVLKKKHTHIHKHISKITVLFTIPACWYFFCKYMYVFMTTYRIVLSYIWANNTEKSQSRPKVQLHQTTHHSDPVISFHHLRPLVHANHLE